MFQSVKAWPRRSNGAGFVAEAEDVFVVRHDVGQREGVAVEADGLGLLLDHFPLRIANGHQHVAAANGDLELRGTEADALGGVGGLH